MYDQNDISQSMERGGELRGRGGVCLPANVPRCECGDTRALPYIKLVTNGSGKVFPVDENGKPLGNTTDNSAIRTQQGFQAIKERFKLLDSARKILDGERTQH